MKCPKLESIGLPNLHHRIYSIISWLENIAFWLGIQALIGWSKVAASCAFNGRICELCWEDDYGNAAMSKAMGMREEKSKLFVLIVLEKW